MPHDPIPYDPTWRALFFPEKDAPAKGFSADWGCDEICAELSRLAYVRFEKKDRARLGQILKAAGFGEPECFHNGWTGAQGFGTTGPDGTVYVAFRGTQITSPLDALADAAFLPVPRRGGGWIHFGFWLTYRSLHKPIERWLGKHAGARLVITGHSLGAAMATVMAARHPGAGLVTFGSPRVGTRRFAALFAAPRYVRRYADCTDIVARVPPPFGYTHAREMYFVDHDGRVWPEPDRATVRADRRAGRLLFRRVYGFRLRNAWFRGLADHAPVNYISGVLGCRVPMAAPTP
jgi:triacylglycerol lipase